MATTYYVDGAGGSDGNAGTSFALAFATPSKLQSVMADGDTGIICNTATYTLTSTVTWTAAGTAANGGLTIIGGDGSGNPLTATGTPPTITSATNSVALFSLNGCAFHRFRFLKFTHTAATRGDGFACVTAAPTNIILEGVTIDGCATGFNGGSRDVTGVLFLADCAILNCTGAGVVNANAAGGGVVLRDTVIYNCASHGYSSNGSTTTTRVLRCVIANNGGKGLYDTGTSRTSTFVVNESVLVENTGDGIRSDATTGSSGTFTLFGSSNLIWGNGGFGVNAQNQAATNTNARSAFGANFYGSNTSGNYNGISAGANDATGIANPFVSKGAGKNWALNSTAGAGALVRAAAFPATYRGTSTSNYLDGGAAQHQDAGGGAAPANPLQLIVGAPSTY